MYKEKINLEEFDLTKPDDFTITSSDDVFEELLTTVNRELYDKTDNEYKEGDVVDFEIEDEGWEELMLKEVAEIFESRQVGWAKVSYRHRVEKEDPNDDETDDEKYIKWVFFFDKSNTGISL